MMPIQKKAKWGGGERERIDDIEHLNPVISEANSPRDTASAPESGLPSFHTPGQKYGAMRVRKVLHFSPSPTSQNGSPDGGGAHEHWAKKEGDRQEVREPWPGAE